MVDSAALLVDEVLIVVRAITAHLLAKAGYTRAQAQAGAQSAPFGGSSPSHKSG